ncbi:MAG TPA: TIGR03118 family protein [Ktedonobacteraceae bacterium]|jgi:uncharacterized protein (TIGR03118 family)|nr:TIGR03118 family protein [Ktedonobacteraceae bacterium]
MEFFGKKKQHALVMLTTLLLILGFVVSFFAASPQALAHGKRFEGFFKQRNLVSDIPGRARVTDPNLVNSWGIVADRKARFWIADNGTGVATVYNGRGTPLPKGNPLVIRIPLPKGATGHSAPTGIVLNDTHKFVIKAHGKKAPARLIFDTEDGTIAAWNPKVDRTHAILVVDRSKKGAIYKGLARIKDLLFAANFFAGRVEVFDKKFHLKKSFTDENLPAGYAPFGIRNIRGLLYVTFALQDANKEDDVPGAGHGFVDIFNIHGHLLKRLISRGQLDSPWGLVLAPGEFGPFGRALLVGNFGNGRINAFNPRTGKFLGTLRDKHGQPIINDGLWGLTFGKRIGERNTLFFTAGLNDEQNGLFGSIKFVD